MVHEQNIIGTVVRWTARILSAFSTFILMLFIFGEPSSVTRIRAVELIGLLFFPVGVVAGFVVAWWKEGLGGALTLISVTAFYLVFGRMLTGDRNMGWGFLVFALPGFLFLISSLISPQHRSRTELTKV